MVSETKAKLNSQQVIQTILSGSNPLSRTASLRSKSEEAGSAPPAPISSLIDKGFLLSIKNERKLGCENCLAGLRSAATVSMTSAPSLALETLDWCDCHSAAQLRARVSEWAKYDNSGDVEQSVKDAKRNHLVRLFARSGVPKQFAEYTFSGWDKKAGVDAGKETLRNAVLDYFENGCVEDGDSVWFGIFAYGPSDMGKTGALVPLFKHYVQEGHVGLFIRYNEMMDSLKEYGDGGDLVRQRFDRLCSTAMLFIDELGNPGSQRQPSDYESRMLFELLSSRNDQQLPTFITSNMEPSELAKNFEARTVKRIFELCANCPVGGEPMGVLRGIQF